MSAVHQLRAALRTAPLAADALIAAASRLVMLFVPDPDRPSAS